MRQTAGLPDCSQWLWHRNLHSLHFRPQQTFHNRYCIYQIWLEPVNSYFRQCCQLLAELFGQFGGKNSAAQGEKNNPPVICTFLKAFELQKTNSLSQEKYNISWTFLELQRKRREKQNYHKSAPVWPFLIKIGQKPHIFPAARYFLRPLLSYASNNRPIGNTGFRTRVKI